MKHYFILVPSQYFDMQITFFYLYLRVKRYFINGDMVKQGATFYAF